MSIALITGGTRGIGAATAEAFAEHGYALALAYHSNDQAASETIERLQRQYNVPVIGVKADVAKKSECDRLITTCTSELGGLDVVVNNAAKYWKIPTEEQMAIAAMIKMNGVLAMTSLAAQAGATSVVNISSLFVESNQAAAFSTAYQAGIESLTKNQAQANRGRMRVNCIRPGFTSTDMLFENYTEQELAGMIALTPIGRLIEPKEIGDIVYMVATNPLLTGQIITADGGTTLRRT